MPARPASWSCVSSAGSRWRMPPRALASPRPRSKGNGPQPARGSSAKSTASMDDGDQARHRIVKDQLEALLETALAERLAVIARVRQADEALADELEALLAADAAAGDFLEWEPADDAGAEFPVDFPLIGRRLGSYRMVS